MHASYRPERAVLREPTTTAEFTRHHYEEAADDALLRAKTAIEKSAIKPLKAISTSKFFQPITEEEWQMLDRLLRSPDARGDLSLANPQTRYRAQSALIHALLNHFDEIFSQPECRTFLATFAWDMGMTSRDAPVIPLESMQRTVHRTLRRLGLSGIGNFEFDVLRRKLPGESFRRISGQSHVICWTRDPTFQPVVSAKSLASSSRFPNMLGISSVDLVSRARSDARRGIKVRENPEQDQTPKSIAHLGYYITKAKFASLNRIPAGPNRKRPKLLPDEQRFSLTDALRLADINSHLSPAKALFAFCQGNAVKQDYLRIFRSTEASRHTHNSELRDDVIKRAFGKIWADQNFQPTQIF